MTQNMRITDNRVSEIAALLKVIHDLCDDEVGTRPVDCVAFVITDFVGSVGRLEVLHTL